MDYYTKISDIQMLAMIACLLSYQSLPESFGKPYIPDPMQESNQDSHHDVRISYHFLKNTLNYRPTVIFVRQHEKSWDDEKLDINKIRTNLRVKRKLRTVAEACNYCSILLLIY